MKVLITGATGLIGKRVLLNLFSRGHDLVVISRNPIAAQQELALPISTLAWDATEKEKQDALEDCAAIVHLAGEPIADKRWSASHKHTLNDSRAGTTLTLVEDWVPQMPRLQSWVQASAIGYYGNAIGGHVDENSSRGNGFLAEVCQNWEAASASLERRNIRRCTLRLGVVLDTEGGALAKMLPAFALGAAGVLGSGNQGMSWIHAADLGNLIVSAVEDTRWTGTYNAVAPEPVTNRDFTGTLAKIIGKGPGLPAPAIALKTLLGERAELLLTGPLVQPSRLLAEKFPFQFPNLAAALSDLLCFQDLVPVRRFSAFQWVAKTPSELFPFFSEAANLERITPPSLQFKITGVSEGPFGEGSEIYYRLKIHGVPARWRTRILNWQPPHCFVDNQEKGPYRLWHHTHSFTALRGGTLCQDTVRYQLPLGGFGDATVGGWVTRDVAKIFAYRRTKIQEFFGK